MQMNSVWKLSLGLLLLSSVIGSFAELDFGHCETLVKKWADSSSSREEHVNKDKRSLKDLLFFLHVPRTGGRTYFHW
jgi:hypothetical protein